MLIGPFKQIVTMDRLKSTGPLKDKDLEIIENGGITIHNGRIVEVGSFDSMKKNADTIHEIPYDAVVLPGFIDAHTHICYAGNRYKEYAMRLEGCSYQEIARAGGGILNTVQMTRQASKQELIEGIIKRTKQLLKIGVTTCEVKSGYGLTVETEVKMLEAIKEADQIQPVHLIPTCLAAHVRPKEFESNIEYLEHIAIDLFPILKEKNLTDRIDIFVEDGAFSPKEAKPYLEKAKSAGFTICIHADQFTKQGSTLASQVHAISADHLEATTEREGALLKQANVIPIVLPGASLGLGMEFPKARMLLDQDLPLVIASDWNPGSAPMGDLLIQACLLGANQKLTTAETLAAITTRAAKALSFSDRGVLKKEYLADFSIFNCNDFREITYNQGMLQPSTVFLNGAPV